MPKAKEPKLFIGSSSEAKELVRGLRRNLSGDEVFVDDWVTAKWNPSHSTLGSVEGLLEEADFAAFILTPDDVAVIRGEETGVVRDNVLFELGMSFGRLKRDRTFIIAPTGTKSIARTPSDLLGITAILYDGDEANSVNAMADAASEVWDRIKFLGPKDRDGDALGRGSTLQIDTVADGALHVHESRARYSKDLREAVLEGDNVPAKFQFAEAEGGRYWLKLCKSRSYGYYKKAVAQLRTNQERLAEQVQKAAGTTAVDLVSLGSGDGKKDDILLRAFADDLPDHEYAYYYPIDISDILLVEAVRRVSRNGLKRERFRCKPVLGDFTNLSSLEGIIAHRSNTNVFSLLGNALGSFDESEILSNIRGVMLPGDLVLLEANIGKPEASAAFFKAQAASQWDLSTLDALKIDRDSCELRQEESPERISDVPGTRTLISYAVPEEEPESKYMLSAMHHYDFDRLKECLEKELNIELIDDIADDGVGLLLGKRKG